MPRWCRGCASLCSPRRRCSSAPSTAWSTCSPTSSRPHLGRVRSNAPRRSWREPIPSLSLTSSFAAAMRSRVTSRWSSSSAVSRPTATCLGRKRLAFQTAGIGEYWFFDPVGQTLSVMDLDHRTGEIGGRQGHTALRPPCRSRRLRRARSGSMTCWPWVDWATTPASDDLLREPQIGRRVTGWPLASSSRGVLHDRRWSLWWERSHRGGRR